ncbi:MAG TPA: hypothetical protein VIF34_11010 [Methylocystis sp.]|jgi:hypothetical protein
MQTIVLKGLELFGVLFAIVRAVRRAPEALVDAIEKHALRK